MTDPSGYLTTGTTGGDIATGTGWGTAGGILGYGIATEIGSAGFSLSGLFSGFSPAGAAVGGTSLIFGPAITLSMNPFGGSPSAKFSAPAPSSVANTSPVKPGGSDAVGESRPLAVQGQERAMAAPQAAAAMLEPNAGMRTSEAGRAFIREFEGFVPRARDDGFGNLTTGYGHRVYGSNNPLAMKTLSRADADALLRRDLRIHERAVAKAVTVPLSQNQFDSLVDFSFNAGTASLQDTGLAAAVNRADSAAIWDALNQRTLGGQRGLLARRLGEAEMFESGIYGGRASLLSRTFMLDPMMITP